MGMADEVGDPLLPLSKLIVVFKFVAKKTLMSPLGVAFEDVGRESGHSAQMEFAGSMAGGGMDGVIVSGLDVKQVEIPVILAFVYQH